MVQENIFNKWCWEKRDAHMQRIKLDLCLSPFTRIKSKCIKDLNFKLKILKLLEENTGSSIKDVGVGKDFLIRALFVEELKPVMDNRDVIKLRRFYAVKEAINVV